MIRSFILASGSPRRLDLLRQIGCEPAQVLPADIDETPRKDELPPQYALRIAREKAQAIAALHPSEAVLAADTVVAMGRRVLPKAEDEATARRCLLRLSGRRHRVYTAVALVLPDGTLRQLRVMTQVRFKRLSEQEIADYLASREWQGKAGGYAIQGRAAAFIPAINGSYSNVVGLPLAEVAGLLRKLRNRDILTKPSHIG